MEASATLQIPDTSLLPGPSQTSRPAGSRPVSATVYPPPSSQTNGSHAASRKRASHQVMSSTQQASDEQPAYRDVYAHPAAVAYAAAHPRRTIPKFGPYLLLQTLGEGEFGKVKLGLHGQWGEEVAVKLIRRGNIDTALRMSKVEREIEVLKTIKHPNIVRLYDVIETDKYIGIILEYASGGELFDHILAHRYLKEKDACKLFSQLISGVWYTHQKKIVHRDLKLENLLLDRNRNVIITDFGFANRFEHRADDLMQTSCGSPCYAAPELVISEGLYVGSAVDIWSCGVILYAMLAGYLPFDDDPANPDGDNINLLYKYIVNTPLTFPDYISAEARDLLSMMLVPDPQRRADLAAIMAHPWLAPYAHLFQRSVQDLERLAMDQHQQKRLAYQRQMKQTNAATNATSPDKMQRSQSARADTGPTSGSRSRHPPLPTQSPVFLYETAADGNFYAPSTNPNRRHAASAIVMPTSAAMDDDPFGPPPVAANGTTSNSISATAEDARKDTSSKSPAKSGTAPKSAVTPVKSTPDRKRGQRHTIQLEYGGEDEEPAMPVRPKASTGDAEKENVPVDSARSTKTPIRSASTSAHHTPKNSVDLDGASTPKGPKPLPSPPNVPTATPQSKRRASDAAETRAGSTTPTRGNYSRDTPTLSVAPASPRVQDSSGTTSADESVGPANRGPGSTGSGSGGSTNSRHRKGMSVEKFVGKIWGNGSDSALALHRTPSRAPSNASASGASMSSPAYNKHHTISNGKSSSKSRVSSLFSSSKPTSPPIEKDKSTDSKKSRRNTLTVMVEPISRQIRQRSKGRAATSETPSLNKEKGIAPPISTNVSVSAEAPTPLASKFPPPTPSRSAPLPPGLSIPASTSKASKVMQWFRYKSKGKTPSEVADDYETISHPDTESDNKEKNGIPGVTKQRSAANQPFNRTPFVVVTSETTPAHHPPQATIPSRMNSRASETSVLQSPAISVLSPVNVLSSNKVVKAPPTFNKAAIRLHHGAVDHNNVTTRSPPDVMAHATRVLLEMGIEVQQESDFKYRCVRPKKKKAGGVGSINGLAAFTMIGSAGSNGVDKRGLPLPSTPFGSGGVLRGLLMRRQSSQVSNSGSPNPLLHEGEVNPDMTMASTYKEVVAPTAPEPLYGDRSSDQFDEVRFSVELTRIEGLLDTFSLDIRRLKGNLRSYKFLYDTVRERCDLQRSH